MFIGHYSAALAAGAHPKAPGLGTLFVGAQLVDFAFFTFVMTGTEHMRVSPGFTAMNPMDLYHMPYTHSLLGSLAWAAGFALLIRLWLKAWAPALIGGAVVLSHWFLDLLVHVPDLTLAGSPPKLGFGLWNHPEIEMPLEIGLVALCLWLYLRATRPKAGNAALWTMIAFLAAVQAYNWFGSPPEKVDAAMSLSGLLAFAAAAGIAAWLARGRVRKEAI